MKLIVISSPKNLDDEPKIVTQLFELGLETFHLRKYNMSTRKMKEYISQIPLHFHNRIVIHSHHRLVMKYKLKGIHLTNVHKKRKWHTMLLVRWMQLKRPNLKISTSYRTLGDLYKPNHSFNYDYIFLSPIFDSDSTRFQGAFTEYSLRLAINKNLINVVARGGIYPEVIDKASELGFYGVALYSYLWNSEDPVGQFRKITEDYGDSKFTHE